MHRRPIFISAALLGVTLALGLAVRFAHLGLPLLIVKYGGSALWALAIYWVVSAILPLRRWLAALLIAGGMATAIEFFKLYRSPGVDAFRLTLPGVLILGRYFSVWDLVAYWVAIAAGAAVDWGLRRLAKARA